MEFVLYNKDIPFIDEMFDAIGCGKVTLRAYISLSDTFKNHLRFRQVNVPYVCMCQ